MCRCVPVYDHVCMYACVPKLTSAYSDLEHQCYIELGITFPHFYYWLTFSVLWICLFLEVS